MDDFEIVGQIDEIETIAAGRSIRDLEFLRENWRKRKGIATIRLPNGRMCDAELHWYEAHGIGRRKIRIKRVLE